MSLPKTLMLAALPFLIAAPQSASAETGTDSRSNELDVVSPEETVDTDAGEIGEAPSVDQDDLVELGDDFVLPTLNIPVHAIDDYDLEDTDGDDIGHVLGVVGPDETSATAVIVEFDGPGWFIFDEGDVTRLVDISAFRIENDKLILMADAEEDGRSFPVYKD